MHFATVGSRGMDVYTTAIQMKKNRPGVMLSVLCTAEQLMQIENVLFQETGTLGVRRWPVSRHKLERQAATVETPWGIVEGKLGWIAGDGRASRRSSTRVARSRRRTACRLRPFTMRLCKLMEESNRHLTMSFATLFTAQEDQIFQSTEGLDHGIVRRD